MILNDIKTKLEEIDENVFYGMADDSMKETFWNYIVFNRTVMKHSQNRTGSSDYYAVHIIRENFIPEGLAHEVIAKMQEIDGMKVSLADAQYSYVQKPNTNIVVEMLSLEFVKPCKRLTV